MTSSTARLVALWEQSYHFSDDELATFAKIQEDLRSMTNLRAEESRPEPVEARFDRILPPKVDLMECLPDHLKSTLNIIKEHGQTADHLKRQLKQLSELIASLEAAHRAVKTQSGVMQELWEGLLDQQRRFEAFAERIEEKLTIFTDFDGLQTVLMTCINDVENQRVAISSEAFTVALQKVVSNTKLLSEHPELSKESNIHLWRYRQLVNACVGALAKHLDEAIKIAINAPDTDWNCLVSDLAPTGKLLKEVVDYGLDDQMHGPLLHSCYSKYLGARHSLFVRTHQPSIVDTTFIKRVCENIAAEEMLFDQLFGISPNVQRHLDYFFQQSLSPILDKIRHNIAADNLDAKETLTFPVSARAHAFLDQIKELQA